MVIWEDEKFIIEDKVYKRWLKAYPNVDHDKEVYAATEWYLNNPLKRKTDHQRFLSSWMSRAQKLAERRGINDNTKRITSEETRKYLKNKPRKKGTF